MNGSIFPTIRRYGPSVVVFVIFVIVWQILVEAFKIPVYLVPPPSTILNKILDPSMNWPTQAMTTTYESLMGFGIAIVVGIGTAILIVWSKGFSTIVYPFVITMQIVPKIAFVPLLFIWFGFNYTPRIFTVFLVCYFPIVVSTVAGFSSTEPSMIDLIRSFTSSKLDLLTKALLPSALPSIFAGLKVSVTLAVIGALVAEFVSSTQGLGFVILASQSELNAPVAFAAAALLIVIGFLLYLSIELLERLIVPWKNVVVLGK